MTVTASMDAKYELAHTQVHVSRDLLFSTSWLIAGCPICDEDATPHYISSQESSIENDDPCGLSQCRRRSVNGTTDVGAGWIVTDIASENWSGH